MGGGFESGSKPFVTVGKPPFTIGSVEKDHLTTSGGLPASYLDVQLNRYLNLFGFFFSTFIIFI
jgi:hypothetical protein